MRIAITTTLVLLAAAPAPAKKPASPGGAHAPVPARVTAARCAQGCAQLAAARPGSIVRISGSHLKSTVAVNFAGVIGTTGDDVLAKPTKVTSSYVDVHVPGRAVTGALVLIDAAGAVSNASPRLEIDHGPTRTAAKGTTPPVQAQVTVRHTFFDSRHPAALRFLVSGSSPAAVSVSLVRATDEHVVAAWSPGTVAPGTVESIRWNGLDRATQRSAARGRYEFRVYTSDGTARTARAPARPTAADSFLFYDYEFPIRGKHSYGSAEGRFGAPRNGHIHQGQDVFAQCGTPLVAARGGVVKFAGYQGNAGNYIVIDAQGTGIDQTYMHLREPAFFKKGQSLRTGDVIGHVGDTGDAVGCHLHFEEWAAPGWYTGGSAFDPLPDLKAWDAFS